MLRKNWCDIWIPRPKKHLKKSNSSTYKKNLRGSKFWFSKEIWNPNMALVGFYFRVSGLKSMSNLIILPREHHLPPPHRWFWLWSFITGGYPQEIFLKFWFPSSFGGRTLWNWYPERFFSSFRVLAVVRVENWSKISQKITKAAQNFKKSSLKPLC